VDVALESSRRDNRRHPELSAAGDHHLSSVRQYHATDAGDEGRLLCTLCADLDGIGVTGLAEVPDIDVVAPRGQTETGLIADADIVAARVLPSSPSTPIAVLFWPLVLPRSARAPTAVFELPVVL